MAASGWAHAPAEYVRGLRARRAAALIAAALALGACGESSGDEPPSAASAPGSSASAPPPSASSSGAPGGSPGKEVEFEALLDPGLVSYSVEGRIAAGGQAWTIPKTFFAQDVTAEEPVPALSTCSIAAPSQGTQLRPTPTVIVSHQETLDRSAGDHVSFAFDGEVLTGGGYAHGSGEEWMWSTQQVEVAYGTLKNPGLISVNIAWAGEAGENFTAEKGTVVGSVTCWAATAAEFPAVLEAWAQAHAP